MGEIGTLACTTSSPPPQTQSTFLNLVFYLDMAPEVMRMEKTYDSKVDMFAFGMILFELLFGYHPFKDYNSKYLKNVFFIRL